MFNMNICIKPTTYFFCQLISYVEADTAAFWLGLPHFIITSNNGNNNTFVVIVCSVVFITPFSERKSSLKMIYYKELKEKEINFLKLGYKLL